LKLLITYGLNKINYTQFKKKKLFNKTNLRDRKIKTKLYKIELRKNEFINEN